MKHIVCCACILACLALGSCNVLGPPLEIVVGYAPTQYSQIVDLEFPVLFPPAADIGTLRGTVPDAEIASHGPILGATLAVVQLTSNRQFFITGVRLEDVRYRLMPTPDPGANPIGTTSDIEYVHPTAGLISPITATLSLAPEAQSAVIEVEANATGTFEVGFASALSMWDEIDLDRDGNKFPDDDDEVIEITASLFFEGYLPIGLEFSGAFPPPLQVKLVVQHEV